jgi:MFS family permease
MPTYLSFGLTIMVCGWGVQTFNTTANSVVQLWTEPAMRGRVMAIYVGIVQGCTLFGAPFVGWVANHFGARWSLVVGAAAGLLATVVGIRYRSTLTESAAKRGAVRAVQPETPA